MVQNTNRPDRAAPVVLAICGWSGSGKTTLIEALIPKLLARRPRVAVVKHDAHGVDVDRPGKDSDRLFRAGADVFLSAPDQAFFRFHKNHVPDLPEMLRLAGVRYDLVVVEGHKGTPLPKVWLLSSRETAPPAGIENIIATLPRGSGRVEAVLAIVDRLLSGSAESPGTAPQKPQHRSGLQERQHA